MRKLSSVKFSSSIPGGDRIHYVNQDDVRVVLSRLPEETWSRLRAVHFNDRGARRMGYVTWDRGEIALCALPPRFGITKEIRMGQKPEDFGALSHKKWPKLALRRFMLYEVFLHELGHLQPGEEYSRSRRLKFARERLAEEFAVYWCGRLWAERFDHPDPVHNPPSPEEFIGKEEAALHL